MVCGPRAATVWDDDVMDESPGRLGERLSVAAADAVEVAWEFVKLWLFWPIELIFEVRERLRRP